jgi:hypothetical protein
VTPLGLLLPVSACVAKQAGGACHGEEGGEIEDQGMLVRKEQRDPHVMSNS